MVGDVVGNSRDIRTQFFGDDGHLREGVVIVKLVDGYGPYGYRVHYQRGVIGEGHHVWEYLGLAEPGLSTGSYAPGVPLRFYQGRQKNIADRKLVLVGNWDSWRIGAELEMRLENAGYLSEVID